MRSVSIKLMAQTVDRSLILDKVGRKRVKLCQTVTATLQCQLSKCEHLGPLTSLKPVLNWANVCSRN